MSPKSNLKYAENMFLEVSFLLLSLSLPVDNQFHFPYRLMMFHLAEIAKNVYILFPLLFYIECSKL